MRIPLKSFANFPEFFCIFNEVKMCIFIFCEFLEEVRFLENRNNIFEENSLKAFLRQSLRVFDFSNLSSDSRYFEWVTLNCWSTVVRFSTRSVMGSPLGKTVSQLSFMSSSLSFLRQICLQASSSYREEELLHWFRKTTPTSLSYQIGAQSRY